MEKECQKNTQAPWKGLHVFHRKHVPAKTMKEVDCFKCKLKCDSKVNGNMRKEIFDLFYSLETHEQQKHFVCAHILEKKTKTILGDDNMPNDKRRNVCRQFHLTVEGQKKHVGKKFFMSTLAIGHGFIDHAMKNKHGGLYIGQDRRGRQCPHNKTPDSAIKRAKDHISSLPSVPSHYTRKDTQRQYLASDLNIKKMYGLHQEECKREGLVPVSAKTYRKIFNQCFNLSFHVPKKDQCVTCTLFERKKQGGTVTEEEEKAYKQHLDRKDRARAEKNADKEQAAHDRSKHVVTVDSKAVLQVPCALVSQLYYKRKLSVYNFTVYSLVDGGGTCYTWSEVEGKRGSCETATCVYLYLSSLPASVREVTIYSDCCGGQNRNQNLTAALKHAVTTLPNIHTIKQKYLETGHTQMERDSMHAAITHAKKNTPIYTPSGWDIVLRMARRRKKYTVVPLSHTSFYNFKKIAEVSIHNTRIDTYGRKVNWLQIRFMQLHKGQEDFLYFKATFDEEEFRVLRVTSSAKRKRPKPLKALPLCYKDKLPISEAKKRDLLSLCTSGVIPEEHQDFFRKLSSSSSVGDKLPQPDINDSASTDTSDTD